MILRIACVAIIALSGALWRQTVQRYEADTLAAAQARTIAALQERADLARLAADVAKATATREAARGAEYDALRAALKKGGQDALLPEWFIDYLRELGVGGLR